MNYSQKKNKHILINLKPTEYKKLENQARKEKRTITNTAYLILTKDL